MNSNVITKEGLEALKQELHELEKQHPEVKASMVEAREQGDLSENAGFHISKAKLAEIERRIGELSKIISNARVMENISTDKVGFGTYVKVFEETKHVKIIFRIVNSDDLNQQTNNSVTLISMQSPVAKALMGKKVNDIVSVETRIGDRLYKIISLSDSI